MLTVTQRSIVINTASASKVYDAQALTANKYTQTGDGFITGQRFESVNIVGTCTNAGSVPNTLNAETPYKLNKDTNPANYNITTQPGTLTVEKRNVVVTSGSAVKTASSVKDTGPAVNAEVTVTGDGFVTDEMAKGYPMGTGSQTNVGESQNYIAYSWINTGNPANYNITENFGKLAVIDDGTVPSGVVTGYSGVYDGLCHTGSVTPKDATAATVKYSIDGQSYNLDNAPSYKDVGTYTVYARITSNSDTTSTADFTFQVQIAPREVSLVSADVFKYYDGGALIGNVNDVIGTEQFVAGEFDKITTTGEQKTAGSSLNTYDVSLTKDAKSTNYKIYKSYGVLTVAKRVVTVESGSAIKTESAAHESPVINPTVTVSGDKFIDGELQSGYPVGIGVQSEIGESANEIEYKWNDGFSDENYDITEILGTLKVAPDDECLASATGYEGIYDGQAHSGTVIPAIEDSTIVYYVDDSPVPVTESPAYTDVCEHSINAVVSSGYSSCKVSYNIKITKRQATISTGSDSKVYDGVELICNESKIEGFVDGESVNVKVEGSQKDAGFSDNVFSIDWTNVNRENYNINEQLGTLSVTKRSVILTSGSAVKTASAAKDNPVENPNFYVSGEKFVDGELLAGYPKAIGSRSEVGESANTIKLEWNKGFSDVNYSITENLGRLIVVEDSQAAAVATGYEGIYDGKEHRGVVVPLIESSTIKYYVDDSEDPVDYNPTFKDVGVHTIIAEVAYKYNSCIVSYEVKIYQRPVTISADSAEKVYDGTELTCSTYAIGGSGFAQGESPNIKMTAQSTVTDVNTTEVSNAIDIEVLKKQVGDYKYNNYDFNLVNGTLKVTKRPLILYSKPIGVTEKPVSQSNGLNQPDTVLFNDEADLDALLQTQDVYKQIADLSNAAGIYKELQAIGSDPVLYDGKKHSDETIIEVGKGQVEGHPEIPGMGFADGEGATYMGFREFTDAGTYMNVFKLSLDEGTKANNYDSKILFGAVTIDQREIEFTSADDSKIYDGLPLINDTVTVSGDGFVDGEGADFNVTGIQTEVGQSDNSFEYNMWTDSTKSSNYEVSCNTGSLTVLISDKLGIILPEKTCFTYDGNPHGDPAYATIDGQITEDVTVMYSVDGVRYTSDVPQITEIGSQNVFVSVEADGYETVTASYTLNVQQGDTPQPSPIYNPTSDDVAFDVSDSATLASSTSTTSDCIPLAGLIVLVMASAGFVLFISRKRIK